jgi:hypothetical protein
MHELWNLRAITPAYSAVVDKWLSLLAGPDVKALRDWIIAAVDVERPCAPLYLYGNRGTGKGLFVAGLARLWTLGGPVGQADVVSDYPGRMIECPLVHADVQILDHDPDLIQAAMCDAGESLLRGMRLIVTSNGHLGTLPPNWLSIYTLDAAAEYLASFSARTANRLVEDDEIAAHALYLAEVSRDLSLPS